MKKSAKARVRLRVRQAEYDAMIEHAAPHEQPVLRAAYHRAGSLKCK